MGTRFYRIPSENEILSRKKKLITSCSELDVSPINILYSFSNNENGSPWKEFIMGTKIELGKRSKGNKFGWLFYYKYYTNKDELIKFVKEGRVIDEYGEEWDVDYFLNMAFNWEQPNGKSTSDDSFIDGLRIVNSVF